MVIFKASAGEGSCGRPLKRSLRLIIYGEDRKERKGDNRGKREGQEGGVLGLYLEKDESLWLIFPR